MNKNYQYVLTNVKNHLPLQCQIFDKVKQILTNQNKLTMEKENMESMEAAKTDMEKAISSLEELGYSCSEASDRILSAIECEIRSRRRRIVDSFEKELAKMETSQLHVLAESIKKEVGITK